MICVALSLKDSSWAIGNIGATMSDGMTCGTVAILWKSNSSRLQVVGAGMDSST
jgi:hypothetical protein